MKRLGFLFLLIFFFSVAPAFAYPPGAAYCLSPSNNWIPVAMLATGTVYPGTPPPTALYGNYNGGAAWYPLACDANGNLIPGGTAAGDLSGTYPNPTVAKIRGGAIPTSVNFAGYNSSGQPVASPNTLGCLDGYDHLPCAVMQVPSTLYTGTTTTGATAYSNPPLGMYQMCSAVDVVVPAASAATFETLTLYTSDGNAFVDGATVTATGQWNSLLTNPAKCQAFTINTAGDQSPGVIWELFMNTVTGTPLTLSQVGVVGAVTTYTGTITGGAANAFVGRTFIVSGFTTGGNNATCVATSSTALLFTCATTTQANETHAGTATMQPAFRYAATLMRMQ